MNACPVNAVRSLPNVEQVQEDVGKQVVVWKTPVIVNVRWWVFRLCRLTLMAVFAMIDGGKLLLLILCQTNFLQAQVRTPKSFERPPEGQKDICNIA